MWKSVSLGKYLRCESSLEAYSWMDNIILEDNLGLNLCIVSTTCCIIIISEDQGLVRRGLLADLS